jgi:hypothetical protein
MNFLRDRWRRTAFHQVFETLEPIDRATFWIAVGLGFAVAFSFSVIVHS